MEQVTKIRAKELVELRGYLMSVAMLFLSFNVTPALVGVATFLVHTQVNWNE